MKYIIILGIVYFATAFHELGHYLTSKLFNLRVDTYCIGVGPTVIKTNFRETEFIFKPIPLLGYVDSKENELKKINLLKHWIILLSGVFMNLILTLFSLIMISNYNLFTTLQIIYSKFLKSIIPILSSINVSDIYSPDGDLSSTLKSIPYSGTMHDFWMIVGAINMIMFIGNLVPIPALDGGKVIMITIEKIALKLGASEETIKKITNPIYIASFLIIFSPLIVNEIWAFIRRHGYNYIQIFLYILMCILFVLLIKVIKQTYFYKSLSKK
jgi:regulator of sigma E protease